MGAGAGEVMDDDEKQRANGDGPDERPANQVGKEEALEVVAGGVAQQQRDREQHDAADVPRTRQALAERARLDVFCFWKSRFGRHD